MPEIPFDHAIIRCLLCSKDFPSDVPVKSFLCPDCREKEKARTVYKIYRLDTNLGQRFLLRKETLYSGMSLPEDLATVTSLEEARFLVPDGRSRTTLKSDIEYNLVETWF